MSRACGYYSYDKIKENCFICQFTGTFPYFLIKFLFICAKKTAAVTGKVNSSRIISWGNFLFCFLCGRGGRGVFLDFPQIGGKINSCHASNVMQGRQTLHHTA